MTSASELFHCRRSRFGRNCLDPVGGGGGLDSSLDRTFHHHSHIHGGSNNRRHNHYHQHQINNNTRRDHHDLDGHDPLRRSLVISRHQPHRPSNTASELDTVQVNEGSNQSSSGNIINLDNFGGIQDNLRFSRNERLPGAVLLARERLLERLRGVSLPTRNRRNNRASPAVNRNNLTPGDDFRLVDAGDWETDILRERLAGSTLFTNSISQTEQLLAPQGTSKRLPGLTQEALNCLPLEVFSKIKCSDGGEMLRASQECSICLESFMEGDELMYLPCAHRFHSSCLDPWVRTCGDCPYCRRGIVVSCD